MAYSSSVQFNPQTYELMVKQLESSIYEHLNEPEQKGSKRYEALAVHNKCIYALDKANQLKGRRGLI